MLGSARNIKSKCRNSASPENVLAKKVKLVFMGTEFDSPDELLKTEAGTHLGYGPWLEVSQERINTFAEATGDHQWIHLDADRAKKESPYGTTIAHGYLTLSLTNMFLPDILKVNNVSMAINYGTNKVRFPAPVPAGAKIRLGAELESAEEIDGGVQALVKLTIEVEGQEKPACVVESLGRYMR